jgi:hypothetical protein
VRIASTTTVAGRLPVSVWMWMRRCQVMDELDAARVHFRSATEPFDTSSPAGRLFVQMLGAFAEGVSGVLCNGGDS